MEYKYILIYLYLKNSSEGKKESSKFCRIEGARTRDERRRKCNAINPPSLPYAPAAVIGPHAPCNFNDRAARPHGGLSSWKFKGVRTCHYYASSGCATAGQHK